MNKALITSCPFLVQFCSFTLKILKSEQDILRAAVVLAGKLDYNERMIYQIELKATVRNFSHLA